MESQDSLGEFEEESGSEIQSEEEQQTESKSKAKNKNTKQKPIDKTLLWTRVFDGHGDLGQNIETFKIRMEKPWKATKTKKRQNNRREPWALIFDAKGFNQEFKPLKVEDYAFTDLNLQEQGIIATKIRKQLTERADEMEKQEYQDPKYREQMRL